jgi:hypothetical protein
MLDRWALGGREKGIHDVHNVLSPDDIHCIYKLFPLGDGSVCSNPLRRSLSIMKMTTAGRPGLKQQQFVNATFIIRYVTFPSQET